MTAIYALIDPRTDRVRYVGKTMQSVKARVYDHLRTAQQGRSHKDRWLQGIMLEGLVPEVVVIECAEDDGSGAERFWIELFRAAGANLLNLTDGGEGSPGVRRTEAEKRRLREVNVGKRLTPQHRARISASNRGRAFTEEHRRALSEAQRRRHERDPEHLRRLGLMSRGTPRAKEQTSA